MKIPDIKGLFSIARGALDPRRQQALQQKQAAEKADKVELSSQGQVVQRLAAERTDNRARAAVVAGLRTQFERGELVADSRKTAEAMVDDGLFDDLMQGK
jgi:anti-sigma28 factor (negative regulator of flagellin synthesis)